MGESKGPTGSNRQQLFFSVVCVVSITILLSLYYVSMERMSTSPGGLSGTPIQLRSGYEAEDGYRYLVHGRKCQIRDVDAYDKEIRKFIKTIPYSACGPGNPLTKMEKTSDGLRALLKIDKDVAKSRYPAKVTCCYSYIRRTEVTNTSNSIKIDDKILVSDCVPFKDSVKVKEPFVLVRCRSKRREVYVNAHATVIPTSEILQKLQNAGKAKPRPYSVLMIGIDSISRLNALRTMPSTLLFLRGAGWTELRGYNKIADNTYPNLMAVLTGIEGDAAYEDCLPTQQGRLDRCPLIWYRFRDAGYVTAYGEDTTSISTFNYNKLGFMRPPTDHYLRPYMVAAETHLRTTSEHGLKFCLGAESSADRILGYAQDFAETYANHTSFGFFWMNSFSHNDLNTPSSMDGVFRRFFAGLHESGAIRDTVVVFFSDHGLRFGDILQTKVGWLEERLPLIYLFVPAGFRRNHPDLYANLRANAGRLTTPYDLHLTLQHLLDMSGREVNPNDENSTTPITVSSVHPPRGCSGCPNCTSLFADIPADRSCDEASISPHWCTCTSFSEISRDSELVRHAAHFIVKTIMSTIQAAGPNVSSHCAPLRLTHISIAQSGRSWDGFHTYLLLFIETKPGNAKFEATVSMIDGDASGGNTTSPNSKHLDPKFRLYSSISRLNSYASQSGCVENANLKKYCYCR